MVLKELTCQCLGIRIVTRNVKNAAGRSWEAITTWLYKAISLDSEEYVLSHYSTEVIQYFGTLCHLKALEIRGCQKSLSGGSVCANF
jgi:hypothetical protein